MIYIMDRIKENNRAVKQGGYKMKKAYKEQLIKECAKRGLLSDSYIKTGGYKFLDNILSIVVQKELKQEFNPRFDAISFLNESKLKEV